MNATGPEVGTKRTLQLRDNDQIRPGLAAHHPPESVVIQARLRRDGSNASITDHFLDVQHEPTGHLAYAIGVTHLRPIRSPVNGT